MKTGIGLFSQLTQNFKAVVTKAAAYSVLIADELVNINGTYTMTLYDIAVTLAGSNYSEKLIGFKNVHATAVGTVAAATGNTIGGRASIALQPGESILIKGKIGSTDWEIVSPSPMPAGVRNIIPLVVVTNGTTPVNVVDASGCPVTGLIVNVQTCSQDASAGNVTVTNANGTVTTIAKGTYVGTLVGVTGTMTTPQMTAGDPLTVVCDGTGNARVTIMLSTQQLTING